MNRTKIAFIKTGYAVWLTKNNDDSNAFFCWSNTYNRLSYSIPSAHYTRQNGKLLPFNRIVFTVNNRISVCAFASKIYLVFFVIIFKFYKPYFIHKPISWTFLF